MLIIYTLDKTESGTTYKKVIGKIPESALDKCQLTKDAIVVDELDFVPDEGLTMRQRLIEFYVDSFEPIFESYISDDDWVAVTGKSCGEVLRGLDIALASTGEKATIYYNSYTAFIVPEMADVISEDTFEFINASMAELRKILDGHDPVLWIKSHARNFIAVRAVEKVNREYRNLNFELIETRSQVSFLAGNAMYYRRYSDIVDVVEVCDSMALDARSLCMGALSDIIGMPKCNKPIPSGQTPEQALEDIIKYVFNHDRGDNRFGK